MRLIGVLQAWFLQDILVEKEVFDAKVKARQLILEQFGETVADAPIEPADATPDNVVRIDKNDLTHVGYFPRIVYDEKGRPRPAAVAYDNDYSDDPTPASAAEGDLRHVGTVDTDDEASVVRFPGLDPPLG